GAAAARRSGARARPPATSRSCAAPTTTATATLCCSSSTSGVAAPATPASAPASSGRSAPTPTRPRSGPRPVAPEPRPPMLRPSRTEFRALASDHTVIPVWRELLADLTTPVAAFARLAGEGTGFLLESVEHGEARWSRWSFVGRNPLATLTCRGRDVEVEGHVADGVPRDRGIRAALDALLAAWHSPSLPDLPPLHGGVLGYLGYDVVREVEHLPDPPPDDRGYPDAVVSVIGQLAAY